MPGQCPHRSVPLHCVVQRKQYVQSGSAVYRSAVAQCATMPLRDFDTVVRELAGTRVLARHVLCNIITA